MLNRVLTGLAFVVTACNPGRFEIDDVDTTGPRQPPRSSVGAALSDAVAIVDLTLDGGRHEGRHHVEVLRGGCSYGVVGGDAFGVQYERPTSDPKELSSLLVIVPDPEEGGATTDQLEVALGFGPRDAATRYVIDARRGVKERLGTGEAHLVDRGDTAHLHLRGRTDDGVRVEASIECARMVRMR